MTPVEFSRMVTVDTLSADDVTEEIEAGPAERDALASRFDLVALHRLSARIRLTRLEGGKMVRVRGSLAATVCQTCVVSLEPFDSTVTEEFGALFVRGEILPPHEVELDLDPEQADEDWPEPMIGGKIDLGELTAQHLSLSLEPYPRRPGIELILPAPIDDEEELAVSPFGALARLSGRK